MLAYRCVFSNSILRIQEFAVHPPIGIDNLTYDCKPPLYKAGEL